MTIQEMFLKIVFNSPELHDEEDEPIFSTLHNRKLDIFLVQHRSKFFFPIGMFLVEGRKSTRLGGFALAFGMQNHSHPISTHDVRIALLKFPARCCSIS